jgi:hypothetical protein
MKEDYQNAIESERQRRAEALKNITQATLAPFDNGLIIRYADTALEAYLTIQSLKSEMNMKYPHVCSCSCGQAI